MYSIVPATPRNLQPRYNITPTSQVGVITKSEDGANHYSEKRWWLVPGWWSKTLKDVPATFNARKEDISGKPMFRNALKKRRCLIPCSGFFEWTGPKTDRQPWFISAKDGRPLTFAGLHETWKDRVTDELVESCTIITAAANEFMKPIHDRMPVILQPEDWAEWLQEPNEELLRSAPEDTLQAWPVSKNVNKNDYRGTDTAVAVEIVATA
ncbi:putative SOS response-associated peptidase YedK [Phyllobacterium sp. P30BS-XVII]|nr:putative SOS response-associated peptidase YedK [Phyllobacterium sp. P30BS-XVII]